MTDLRDSSRAVETPPGADASDADQAVQKGLGWGYYCVPVFIFIFCAVISYVSSTFDEVLPLIVGDSMQPRVFPIFLMVLMAILQSFAKWGGSTM